MLTIAIIAIIVLSALIWVLMPRKRSQYHTETGHSARLAATIDAINTTKVMRRLK